MPYSAYQSPWIRYGLAILAVIVAVLTILYLPIIGEWGKGSLVCFFFASILVTFWLGLYPGLLALSLSLVSINTFELRSIWIVDPSDAILFNLGFCLLSSAIIVTSHYHQKLYKRLSEHKEDLALAQSVAQIGNWRFNLQNGEWLWSAETYRIFGIPVGAAVSYQSFLEKIHPDDRKFVKAMEQAALLGKPYDIEHRIIVAGKIKWIHEKSVLEFAKDGKLVSGFGITQDITDRKQAKQALIEREQELKIIINLSPDLICYLDTEFRYIRANKTFTTWWGKQPEQVIGREVREIVGESTWNIIKPYLERARLGEAVNFDQQLWQNQDSFRWVHVNYVPDIDSSGNVKGIVAQISNITDRKLTEQSLRDAEDRMRLATQASGVGVWEWNIITNRIRWDAKMFEIYGIPETQDGFVEYDTWANAVLPEDLRKREQLLQEIIRTKGLKFRDFRIEREKDKTPRYIQSVEIVRTNAQGEPEWVIGTNLDITDRKYAEMGLIERENQLRLIMNLTPALISYLDADLRYVRVNKTYEEWFGKAVKDIIGHTVPEIVGENTWQNVQGYLERAQRGEQVSYEHRLTLRNNTARWVCATLVPDKDASGVVIGIVVHVADIEERKKAEQALLDGEQRLRLATEATGVGVWEWNLLTDKHRWDEQMFRIYGIAPTPAGTDFYKIWRDSVLPEDLPEQEAAVQHSIRSGDYSRRQFRIYRPGENAWRTIETVEIARKNNQGETEWLLGTNLDITDRKNAELALLKQEHELRLIINAMPALIAYVDTDFRYVRANSTYLQWLGIPTENIIGKEIKDIVGETAWQKIKPYMQQAMSGEQVHYELEIPYKTAKARWIHANYVPDKDPSGQVKGLVALIIDIGEMKQATQEIAFLNQSLQHRIEELEAVFNTAPIGLAITTDLEGKHIRGNPALEKMLGLPRRSELSLRTTPPQAYQVFVNDNELSVEQLPMQRAIHGETITNQIVAIKRPDGQLLTVLSNATPLLDEQANPRGAIGAFLDISELKNAESALRESEERLRLAQIAGSLGIFDHKLLTNEITWDNRLRELWGIKPHESISLAAFLSAVHPDDREHLKTAVIRSLDPKNNGEYHTEYRVIRPSDKQLFWIAAFGIITFDNDRPIRLVGFVQDISERKRIEEALRLSEIQLSLAMTELKAGFWEWEREGNKSFFSVGWKQQIGYEDHEIPNRQEEWEKRLHPDDKPYVIETVNFHLNHFLPSYDLEFRLQHKDGSYRWIHSRAALIHDRNNQLTRISGVHLDITDFKKQTEMHLQREKMEETFRFNIASQTLAAIAHELNQPLTAISYFADVAIDMVDADDLKSQKLCRILENCSEQSQRAGQVIRQLLTVLQKRDSICEVVDINKAIQSVYELSKANGQLKGYKLNLNLATNLPFVNANDLQLQKVLITLISNAMESMQESPGKDRILTISTSRSQHNPDMAQITVCDNGIGIADAGLLNDMFKPFFTTKNKGLGMGLAISRTLIESYGGKMWAEQNADAGLSVNFTLPLAA